MYQYLIDELTDDAPPTEVPVIDQEGNDEGVGVGLSFLASHDPAVVAVVCVRDLTPRVKQVRVQDDPVLVLARLDVDSWLCVRKRIVAE